MVIDIKKRVLENLAYRYWTKNPKRTDKENWALAEKFLQKLEKRYLKPELN